MTNVHTIQPGYYGAGSVEISPPSGPGEGGVRRCILSKDKLVTQPLEGIDTVWDIVSYAARVHGNRKALGWREILAVHEEEKEVNKVVEGEEVKEKKKWKFFELSDYKYLSFVEVKEAVSEIARALINLGVTEDDIFAVYARTSMNWQLMAHACTSISTTISTAYDTLSEDGLTHALTEPNCMGLFTNAELLPTLYRVLAKTPNIRYIVFDGEPTESLIADLKSVRQSIQVFSISNLRDIGKALPIDPLESRLPKPDKVAVIMYTSGSAAPSKGVCLTHANLVASVGAVRVLLGHHLSYEDSYLAYLPLAHVLEYIVELIMLFVGVPSGYGRVKTLTDTSVRNCKGDISAFRPSIMVGVPDVWETIRKGILAKVNAGGAIKSALFYGAMAIKKYKTPILSSLADSFILNAVRAAAGGRLRIALSGGASISKETQEFVTNSLVMLLRGYGMTESCGVCTILPPELMRYNSVGLPVPSVEIKLRDVPELGYFSTNDPPQGEVCVRGPSVVMGYYKRPDLNMDENIYTKDGWWRTADIGQWNSDGTLEIIDRLKNIIKLASGEYIALEHLESIYKACKLVANICLHATQEANQPMAIVVPHEVHLRSYLQDRGLDASADLGVLCNNPAIQEAVLKECNTVGRENNFKPTELLQAVILTPNEWTPESGLVTAAQKIQRVAISKAFKNQIDAVYKHA